MAFLLNWVSQAATQALDYFGITQYFSGKEAKKLVFLGLDNAGKTTLFQLLRTGKLISRLPTDKANSDDLVINGIQFKTFDVGGHVAMRRIWKDYCSDVDGIVFLIDAADKERFNECNEELNALLLSNELKDIPILILGNKVDKKGSVNEAMLKKYFGMTETTGKDPKKQPEDMRPMEVFMCSLVMKSTGFADGLKWLTNVI
eukprot:CAMPEP_0201576886 /NCGR_PEP_ID=MMETSP0190_2-20130828/22950_1 /ASSEMBLY_ACC=CAM_ASM_000263 /TAXON_ID=37353 /ORGANISM="Rosalina sp." /LENGTH=201 /DNA_ID=CAMNT_0048008269 /DNA_START=135 /DNA_END=740 /DNA_ORIENTATION=+